jgi:hypothetical protein
MVMTITPSLDGLDHFVLLCEVVEGMEPEESALPRHAAGVLMTQVAEIDPKGVNFHGELVRLALRGAEST